MEEKMIDGIELLRMIRDGKILNGTKIRNVTRFSGDKEDNYFKLCFKDQYIHKYIFKDGIQYDAEVNLHDLIYNKFEILSEKIDIQAIEKIERVSMSYDKTEDFNTMRNIANKVNELIGAIKQLDKDVNDNGRN